MEKIHFPDDWENPLVRHYKSMLTGFYQDAEGTIPVVAANRAGDGFKPKRTFHGSPPVSVEDPNIALSGIRLVAAGPGQGQPAEVPDPVHKIPRAKVQERPLRGTASLLVTGP